MGYYKDYITKEEWDGMQTKEQLFNEFDTDSNSVAFSFEPEMPLFYKDEEFKTAAAKIKKAAAPLLPLLKDVLKHLPEKDENKYTFYPERAEGAIDKRISPDTADGMALYAGILLLALESDFIERLAKGFGIPEQRAGRRAYRRYKAIKEKIAARRAEFEQTADFRMQNMELKLGIRDHITYPEDAEY